MRARPTIPGGLAVPIVVGTLATAAVAVGLFALESSWAALLLYHGVIAASLVVRGRLGADVPRLFHGFSLAGATAAVASSGLAAAGFFLALDTLDPAASRIGGFVERMGPTPATMLAFALYASTVNPVLEELHWRGDPAVHGHGGHAHDLAYSLFHVPVYLFFAHPASALLPVAILYAAGWAWRHAARRFGGLAVPVLGHAAGNLGLMLAVAVKLDVL